MTIQTHRNNPLIAYMCLYFRGGRVTVLVATEVLPQLELVRDVGCVLRPPFEIVPRVHLAHRSPSHSPMLALSSAVYPGIAAAGSMLRSNCDTALVTQW